VAVDRKRPALWLPPSAKIHGLEPKFFCTLCDAVFYDGEHRAYQNHVLSHPREDVLEHSLHHKAPGIFDPNFEGADKEWHEYIDRKTKADPHGWTKWLKTSDGKSGGGTGDGALK